MKYTINTVKDFLKNNDTQNECTLLSTEYKTSEDPLTFKCNICGEIFTRNYKSLRKVKHFCCVKCGNMQKKSSGVKSSIEDVQQYLNEHDINHECILLSTEYKNINSHLKFRCNLCGNEFLRNFNCLKNTKYFCCPDCAHEIGNAKLIKYTQEDVEKKLSEQNCILLEPYPNSVIKPMHCKCSKGHEFTVTFSQVLRKQYVCLQCSYEARRGENSPHWKNGGNQQTTDLIRHSLYDWKKAVLKKFNYKCDICGEESPDLVIHHAKKNFSIILEEASENTGIPILPNIVDYSDEDRDKLIHEVQRLHEVDNGVVITREYHKLFHRKYGTHNNTYEQYQEFKEAQQKNYVFLLVNL